MIRSLPLITAICLLMLFPIACKKKSPTGPPSAAATPTPRPNGRIAFVSGNPANLYAMNSDGTDLKRLTNDSFGDSGGQWSPNGAKLAFQTNYSESCEIAVVNADGTGLQRLTNNTAWEGNAWWSPDGTKLLFTTDRDGNDELYVMNSDGSSPTNLTNSSGDDDNGVWSPDGAKIAFSSNRDGTGRIYTMDASNGSSVTPLAIGGSPCWSPDGTKILFEEGGNIIRMDANGSNPLTLTTSNLDILSAFQNPWSPDASKILFVSLRDGNSEIYTVNSAGGTPVNLTQNASSDSSPAWSPDGKKISFVTNRNGSNEVWLMNVNGSGPVSLASGLAASWRP